MALLSTQADTWPVKSNKTVTPPIGAKWLPARDLLFCRVLEASKNLMILSKNHEFYNFSKTEKTKKKKKI